MSPFLSIQSLQPCERFPSTPVCRFPCGRRISPTLQSSRVSSKIATPHSPPIIMSFEKPASTQRKPRIAIPPPTTHSLLKKTIAHNLTAKATTAAHEVKASATTAKLVSASPPSLNLGKKKAVKDMNSFSGIARPVPSLQLNFSATSFNSPASVNRSTETAASVRGKPAASMQFPMSLNSSGALSVNLSLSSPKKSSDPDEFLGAEGELRDQPEVAYPITAAQAVKLYQGQLTEYEQGEILEIQQIYFLGLSAAKIQGLASQANSGYDDDRGDYKVVLSDHILYRYEVLSILGKGSFGQVCKCFDHKNKETVAVKIIRNKRRFHQQGVVEVKVLDHLRTHDAEDKMCVVKMKNYFVFRKHLCLTFELLSINLYDFLKSNDFAGLSLNLVRRFAIQLIIALRYVRANHIIHCDLKPENILLKQANKSGIKVIDFGSSCFENQRVYTYIQSRFYRAPEIMMGIPYTASIDIWSLGCILAELYTGYPLFPGESEHEQMLCIMEVIGVPPAPLLEQATRKKLFFDSSSNPKLIANSRGKKRLPGTKTLQMALKSADSGFVDFVSECLQWDPATRLSPDSALKHHWIVEGITKMQQAAEQTDRKRSAPRTSDKPKSAVGDLHGGHRH